MKTTCFLSLFLFCFCLLPVYSAVTPPSDLKAKVNSSTEIALTWQKNTDATAWQLERSLNGINYEVIAEVDANTGAYTDASLGIGVVYGYRLRTVKNTELSDYVYSEILATPDEPLLPNVASIPGSKVTVQYENQSSSSEKSPNVIDDDITTKYLFYRSSGWIRVELPKGYAVKGYVLVSANDAENRDPKNWKLEATNDINAPWVTLDTRTSHYFISRFCPLRFNVNNTTEYKYYRLSITANRDGGGMTQLADLKLFAERSESDILTEEIAAPANLTATANAFHLVTLKWKDNANNEDAYLLQRSTDGVNWDWEKRFGKNYSEVYSAKLEGETTYYYRVRAENQYKQSPWAEVSVTTPADIAPESIREDWGDHNKLTLYKKYSDAEVAVYFDEDMDQTITWPFQMMGDAWKYFKSVYGDYSDPRLYVYFHAQQYSGGHPATWGSKSHHYRNAIDNGSGAPGSISWQTINDGWGIPIHEISHIIEGGSWHMLGSPEAGCWGDSKFAEIHAYDWALAMAKLDGDPYQSKNRSLSLFNQLMNTSDSSTPHAGCYWFRDFWYPIYSQFGGADMLAKFFQLMYEYYPKKNLEYVGGMNYGEFVHFYSGACGVDIREYADNAFTWTQEWEYQFKKAQIAYPFTYLPAPVKFTRDGGEITAQFPIKETDPTTDPRLLIDKDVNTFYKRLDATSTSYWVQYHSQKRYQLTGYNLTSSATNPQYNPKSWTLSGSNDGLNWEVLDTQSEYEFLARKKTDFFAVNTEQSYRYFRLNITQMAGAGARTVQLAEWELLGYEDNGQTAIRQPATFDEFDLTRPLYGNLTVYDLMGKTVVNRVCSGEKWDEVISLLHLPKGTVVIGSLKTKNAPAQFKKILIR